MPFFMQHGDILMQLRRRNIAQVWKGKVSKRKAFAAIGKFDLLADKMT